MGMYTELYLGIELSKDTHENIVKWLESHNVEYGWQKTMELAPDCLKETRLNILCGSSCYLDAQPHFQFFKDKITGNFFLTFGCNIKNYSGEIDKLLRLLEPHITSYNHIGHYRYEESDTPTLLYMVDGKIIENEVAFVNNGELNV